MISQKSTAADLKAVCENFLTHTWHAELVSASFSITLYAGSKTLIQSVIHFFCLPKKSKQKKCRQNQYTAWFCPIALIKL